jgi:hypothetical protein
LAVVVAIARDVTSMRPAVFWRILAKTAFSFTTKAPRTQQKIAR